MKRLCLVLGSVCLAGNAVASDPTIKPPAEVALPYSWTGFYVGGTAGQYQSNVQTVTISTPDPPGTLGPSAGPVAPTSFSSSGLAGGIHLGYNWQPVPLFLIGFEADQDFVSIQAHDSSFNLSTVGAIPFTSETAQTLQWFSTVRARLGIVPVDRLLIYGTGGLAFGRIEQSATYTNTAQFLSLSSVNGICHSDSVCYSGLRSLTANGWTAGGGIEYALPNNWTIRAEYLYVKLDSRDSFDEDVVARQFGPFPPSKLVAHYNSGLAFQVVRAGISYKF